MAATGKKATTKSNGQRGATVVEFAVIASLLLVLVFGILEFAMIFVQQHLVENGAREGMRVGVIANNYTSFGSDDPDCSALPHKCNREKAAREAVENYLDIFYATPPTNPKVSVTAEVADNQKVLRVSVEVENFMPRLISALVPGYNTPTTFNYTATGFYEDPTEE